MLSELLDQLALDAPVVVGHDIGGAVVLRAHLLGAAFSRIALVDAVVLAPWITPRTRRMQAELDRYEPLPSEELAAVIREHLRTATHRPLDDDVYEALFGQWSSAHGQALYLRNLAQLDEAHTREFEPLLGSLAAPTLVVWGERDAWLPVEVSERIATAIPGARRVVVPDAGHFSMVDQPKAIAAALDDFLAERP